MMVVVGQLWCVRDEQAGGHIRYSTELGALRQMVKHLGIFVCVGSGGWCASAAVRLPVVGSPGRSELDCWDLGLGRRVENGSALSPCKEEL